MIARHFARHSRRRVNYVTRTLLRITIIQK